MAPETRPRLPCPAHLRPAGAPQRGPPRLRPGPVPARPVGPGPTALPGCTQPPAAPTGCCRIGRASLVAPGSAAPGPLRPDQPRRARCALEPPRRSRACRAVLTLKSCHMLTISAHGGATSVRPVSLPTGLGAASRHPRNGHADGIARTSCDVSRGPTEMCQPAAPGRQVPDGAPDRPDRPDAGKTKVWLQPLHVTNAEYAFSVARNYPHSWISQVTLGSAGRQRSPFWIGRAPARMDGPAVITKFPELRDHRSELGRIPLRDSAVVRRSFCHDLFHAHEFRPRHRGCPGYFVISSLRLCPAC